MIYTNIIVEVINLLQYKGFYTTDEDAYCVKMTNDKFNCIVIREGNACNLTLFRPHCCVTSEKTITTYGEAVEFIDNWLEARA